MSLQTSELPVILGGLGEIASGYDALLCDVWGVLHDGRQVRRPDAEALHRFRRARGPVILLSNAPRPIEDIQEQFVRAVQDAASKIHREAVAHTLPKPLLT